ncbi:MAG: protein translocase subunit SecDF, partial [Prevotella sp.]|nr:protein translocase subunit SecDF [Prevotella sp.]
MQNKGIVKFIAVALMLVCIFYLSFSFVTRYHEGKAAAMEEKAGQAYLDSVMNTPVYLWTYNLKECREMEIGLGLDLKGGMNVILEVSVPDIVDMLADHKQDAGYRKALEQAKKEEEKSQSDFISLFIDQWKKEGGGRSLASIFATQQLKDKVFTNSSDADVEKALRAEVQSAIDNAENVVRNRVDKFGVVQPNIQKLEGQSRIMVEMPGVKEPERVRKLLQGSANLEFWETFNAQEIIPYLNQLSSAYAAEMSHQSTSDVAADTTSVGEEAAADVAEAVADTAKAQSDLAAKLAKNDVESASTDEELERLKKQNPLIMLDTRYAGLAMVGYANAHDTADINKVIYSEIAKKVLPNDLKLLWGAKAERMRDVKAEIYALYAIKVTAPSGKAPLAGEVITNAKDEFDQMSQPVVSMQMNAEGTRTWANLTKMNIDKAIAIVLDDAVYSAPRVNSEITGGNSQISGNFTIDDTKDLANTLNSGKMPAPTRIVQEQVVGPTLGAQSIRQGAISFVVAFVLLMCVMVLLYNWIPGMLANMALLFNLFFTLGILASFQAALTMPGIAGIVLTLGTAVDANVLIYERTKEELRKGLNIKEALNLGYSNAFSAIFDSNLTSLITGIILYVFGTGPIRGFATTLIIGICVSFFTAVFMTRLIYDHQMKKDKWQNLTFTTSFSKNLMQNMHINFMSKYKMSYAIWGVAALVFLGSFFTRGLDRSIDFTGGRNYVLTLDKQVPVEQVREVVSNVFTEDEGKVAYTSVIALGAASEKTVRISTNWKITSNDPAVDDEAETILYNALKGAGLVAQDNIESFKNPDVREGGSIIESSKVGPSVAKTITRGAVVSVILALFFIFLYILVRFRNVAFSIGSIVALAFDALIVIGFY